MWRFNVLFYCVLHQSTKFGSLGRETTIFSVQFHLKCELNLQKLKSAANCMRYSRFFSNAWLIISIFGAGETNMVFSEAGTVTIEITSLRRGFLYLRQSMSLGHRFFGYAGTGDSNALIVDPKEVAQIGNYY